MCVKSDKVKMRMYLEMATSNEVQTFEIVIQK